MSESQGSKMSTVIAASGKDQALETVGHPQIGIVVNYHRYAGTEKKPGNCNCARHKGAVLEVEERHSVDIEIKVGQKVETLLSVPCFIYAQGVISKGFVKNDKILILYINGDRTMPIAAAYYRHPKSLEAFWNNLRFQVGDFMLDLLPKIG